MTQPNYLPTQEFTPIPQGDVMDKAPELSSREQILHARDELQEENGPSAESMKDLSSVMYGFMADDLAQTAVEQGKGETVVGLLQESAKDAQIKAVEIVQSDQSSMSPDGTMRISRSLIMSSKSYLIKQEERFQFKRPGDRRLLEAVHLVAHETAHNIIHSAERTLAEKAGISTGDAIASYLLRNPLEGFTGNLDTDRSIMHERFAEQGRIAATKKTMELIGYEPQEANHYLGLVAHTPELRTHNKQGHSQADVLSGVTATTGSEELLSKGADSTLKLKGYLGYAKPLTSEQAVDLLDDVAREGLVDAPEKLAEKYFTELKAKHTQHPDADAPAYLRKLQHIRQEDLHGQRETRTARALGRLVARLTNTPTALSNLNRTQRTTIQDTFPAEPPRLFIPRQQTSESNPQGSHHIRIDHIPAGPISPTGRIKL